MSDARDTRAKRSRWNSPVGPAKIDMSAQARHSTLFFFCSSRRRHTRCYRDWSSDVCSSDLFEREVERLRPRPEEPGERDAHEVDLRDPELSLDRLREVDLVALRVDHLVSTERPDLEVDRRRIEADDQHAGRLGRRRGGPGERGGGADESERRGNREEALHGILL